MDIIVAIILGIVEGITEFIPVSSTGHMILTSRLMGYDDQSSVMNSFEIVIQLGAILAIAWVYRFRILNLLGLQKDSQTSRAIGKPAGKLNLIHILLGIVPALAVGYIFKDHIKSLFSASTVLWALVVGGIFMIFAEWYNKRYARVSAEDIDQISYTQAFLIGIFQCISVLWPGFSRSGSTISGGMISGVSYRASADFSFLIAVPIMIAVSGYELLDSYKDMNSDTLLAFAIGFVVSFIVAYLVVLAFLKLIQKVQLRHFAYYRFVLAAVFWIFIMN
ncbi:undecaprenyl-diphosphate phosphatase [Paenibacillus physcomitrellae]|uniref:Undecaprenyl-diphosphatase n=1 Tax=Paenibacillus physcomitrellae TaxID=1619311 RepID=A0ABQ1GXT7_9BACL|nr:undecaprenyl-diphosphate phosphatase [Paenibacillus physcomitrellae]GGA52586.1 undecaprenyl-diphosphatase 2 [Paenibacillus physcomitrellae]